MIAATPMPSRPVSGPTLGAIFPTPSTLDQDAAWRAVLQRDRAADGLFYFAVTSTGVYCRPSCPSRHARRDRVRFFRTPDTAEEAGFRACLRCRPRGGPSGAEQSVARARALLEERAGERVSLAELSEAVGLSPTHLQRVFTAHVGLSPRAYAARLRESRLRQALRREPTVTRAIYEAGYAAPSRAYERADRELGMTPAAYRRRGEGVRLRIAVAPCRLGHVAVAATDRGIAAVRLGNNSRKLVEDIRAEFDRATIVASDAALAAMVRDVVRLADGMGLDHVLPVDVAGTEFQQRVWELLRAVPSGETITYQELARRLGRPSAVRAVARAVATNPAAIVIPCHRVVRSDGQLGGYRWGPERKERLLKAEGAV